MVEVPMVLAPNPSHLEAVNPVVVGMVGRRRTSAINQGSRSATTRPAWPS